MFAPNNIFLRQKILSKAQTYFFPYILSYVTMIRKRMALPPKPKISEMFCGTIHSNRFASSGWTGHLNISPICYRCYSDNFNMDYSIFIDGSSRPIKQTWPHPTSTCIAKPTNNQDDSYFKLSPGTTYPKQQRFIQPYTTANATFSNS